MVIFVNHIEEVHTELYVTWSPCTKPTKCLFKVLYFVATLSKDLG